MKPTTILVIFLAIVLVIAGVFVAIYLGFLPDITGLNITDNDNPEGAEKLTFSKLEIVHVIEILRGKDLVDQDVLPFVDSLHMELYGIDGKSAYDVHQEYKTMYEEDEYVSQAYNADSHSGWVAYHEMWSKGFNGKSISVGDGTAVTTAYGYDTMILTSYGPLTTYANFATVL